MINFKDAVSKMKLRLFLYKIKLYGLSEGDLLKTGLVLEGGAMRGMFTAGVLDVLLENKINFSGAVGVSAGTAFGVNLKSRQKGRVLRYNLRFAGKPYYASWRSWRRSGNLYARNFCYHLLPERLDPFDKKTFAANPMEFWSVSTNAETGQPEYTLLKNGDYTDLEWVRASSSIPFFAHPVAIHGNFYFDGGVSDSIPLAFAEQRYDKNVVIATQPRNYRKKRDKLWPLERILLRRYPAVLAKIKTRSQDYNACLDQIAQEERAGRIFVVKPPFALKIGTLEKNPDQIKRVYQLGRKEMQKQLSKLEQFLGEEK